MDTNTKKLFKAAKRNLFQKVVTLIEKKGVSTTTVNKKGRTIGHFAVRNANFDMLKYVVDKDPSILRIKDDNFYNIFHLAVKRGALNMVKYLVEKYEEDIFQRFAPDFGDTGTALHRAVKFGHLDMVKYFVGERNVDVNGCVENQKQPPLFLAVRYKHPDIVNYLMDERNANLTLVDHNGENILFPAVRNNDLNLVKRVLDEKKAKIDVDSKNNKGEPIISEATISPFGYKMEILKYLVEKKNANINVVVPRFDLVSIEAPLLYRVFSNERVFKYLVERGADITASRYFGANFLHESVSANMCKFLIEHGVNINQKDEFQETPLSEAIRKNRYEVFPCLIEGGADWKPYLDLIIDLERKDQLKYLVKKMKIDLNLLDQEGKTPLQRAARDGRSNACHLLVNFGADINRQDKLGNTALHYAAMKGNDQICKDLVNLGADARIKNNGSQVPADMVQRDHEKSLKNFLEESAASKRSRRGTVEYYAAAALPLSQIVDSVEKGQQKIAAGDLQYKGIIYENRETGSLNLQNWLLFAHLLFGNAIKFLPSRPLVPRPTVIGGDYDPIAEDAIDALPFFRIQN